VQELVIDLSECPNVNADSPDTGGLEPPGHRGVRYSQTGYSRVVGTLDR